MKLISAHVALGVPPQVLDVSGLGFVVAAAELTDFYCADADCDCRTAYMVLRGVGDEVQQAAIAYRFDAPERDAVSFAHGLAQGVDAERWCDRVRSTLLATRAQRCVYEARYLRVKAAAIDPTTSRHAAVRRAAGLPPLPIPPWASTVRRRPFAAPSPSLARDLSAEAASVLSLGNAALQLTGAELTVLAMARSEAPQLTPHEVVALLFEGGFPRHNPRKLAARVFQSSRDSARFARPADDVFLRLPMPLLTRAVGAVLAREPVRLALEMRARSLRPQPAVAPVASKPAVSPSAVSQPAAPKPEAVAAPQVPEAPAFKPLARTVPTLSGASLEALADAPMSSPEAVRLALEAQRLASAAQFDELLALASMRGVTPHRYQTETVRRVLRALRGRAILADEVGLGKTVEAIMALREYQARGMVRRALILVPPTLVAQWAGELYEKADVVARTTDDPRFREDPAGFLAEPGVVVASLALLRLAKHAPAALAAPWDLVVVDEAHHIKNRATLGYKLVSELKRRFLLLVTATPVENDLEEIYNLVTLLRPGQFDTPAAFRKRFVDPKDPTRPRDREALRALLAEVMVRNTRAQSGLALPPRFVSTLAVDPSPPERDLYDAVVAFVRAHHDEAPLALAATSLLLEAGSSARAVRATLARMTEKRQGRESKALRAELTDLMAKADAVRAPRKVDALLGVLASQRDAVLVFTRFRETLDEVVAAVERAGAAAVPFHGGLDERARRASLERFRQGGAVVMVATAAGSEGHNLQHCNVLVNYDLPWNPMAIEQRIGRLHRMGQTREVHVYNLCARGTVEERVLDVLDRRVQLFQLVVGEMDMVLGNLADERDLEDWLVAAVARSKSDAEVDATFNRLAADLFAARGRYEKTRSLDEALFGKDFEA